MQTCAHRPMQYTLVNVPNVSCTLTTLCATVCIHVSSPSYITTIGVKLNFFHN